MSAARRSLLTATAAGTLLGALWFVPSANATQDVPTPATPASAPTVSATTPKSAGSDDTGTRTLSGENGTRPLSADDGTRTLSGGDGAGTPSAGDGTRLADTGAVDTTPYLVGGTLFLGLGAGFVTYSVRRERMIAY
ncbi:cell wall protein [Streptomyces sp. NPDC002516]